MRRVEVDGSAARARELATALAAALDGGPAVLPVEPGSTVAASTAPDPGIAVVISTSGSSGKPRLVTLSAP
ncbi:MAG TPA: AMP-dependent synthetase, partial [Pseudonocardia sp.]|nr:AMP-dependent synthetase [Pseudonocardia sp.]